MSGRLELLPPPRDLAAAVDEGELARLLGYPVGRRGRLEGRVRQLADAARVWYARNGRPWSAARRLTILAVDGERIEVEGGETLRSRRLAERLRAAEAEELVVAITTAGPEVDEHSATLWGEDRLDEAYFADRFAAAVAEHLAASTVVALRAGYESSGLGLLPGYSPGYDGWPLTDQRPLFRLLARGKGDRYESSCCVESPRRATRTCPPFPGPLEILDSGMLRPKSSLLAAFGLSQRPELAEPLWERGRCSWCSLSPCAFRRPAHAVAQP